MGQKIIGKNADVNQDNLPELSPKFPVRKLSEDENKEILERLKSGGKTGGQHQPVVAETAGKASKIDAGESEKNTGADTSLYLVDNTGKIFNYPNRHDVDYALKKSESMSAQKQGVGVIGGILGFPRDFAKGVGDMASGFVDFVREEPLIVPGMGTLGFAIAESMHNPAMAAVLGTAGAVMLAGQYVLNRRKKRQ